jgi:hypothetical protein
MHLTAFHSKIKLYGRKSCTRPNRKINTYLCQRQTDRLRGRGHAQTDDTGKKSQPASKPTPHARQIQRSKVCSPPTLRTGDSLRVKVTIANIGDRAADAVVELYLHDSVAPVVRPLRELKVFKRVMLAAGEGREAALTAPYRSFGYWDRKLQYVVTKSIFNVMISTDAEHDVLTGQVSVE